MTKKTDAKTNSKTKTATATHIDPVPKKTAATTATTPLHTTDNLEPTPDDLSPALDQRSALDRERADMPEPAVEAALPQPASVPVADPSPSPEPHYPSGADEIMRRHRLIDPLTAEVKAAAVEAESATEGDKEEAGK